MKQNGTLEQRVQNVVWYDKRKQNQLFKCEQITDECTEEVHMMEIQFRYGLSSFLLLGEGRSSFLTLVCLRRKWKNFEWDVRETRASPFIMPRYNSKRHQQQCL